MGLLHMLARRPKLSLLSGRECWGECFIVPNTKDYTMDTESQLSMWMITLIEFHFIIYVALDYPTNLEMCNFISHHKIKLSYDNSCPNILQWYETLQCFDRNDCGRPWSDVKHLPNVFAMGNVKFISCSMWHWTEVAVVPVSSCFEPVSNKLRYTPPQHSEYSYKWYLQGHLLSTNSSAS